MSAIRVKENREPQDRILAGALSCCILKEQAAKGESLADNKLCLNAYWYFYIPLTWVFAKSRHLWHKVSLEKKTDLAFQLRL